MESYLSEYAPGDVARASLWDGMRPELVTIVERCEKPCPTDGLPQYRCETPAGMAVVLCSSVLFAIKNEP